MDTQSVKICLLCKVRIANKKNSHVLSKFFNNRLRYDGYFYLVEKDKNIRKIQKTPAEDYILCEQCEHRIEIVETYCSQNFFNRFHHETPIKSTSIFNDNYSESEYMPFYKECIQLNPKIFNLFIVSLIWRASISSNSRWFSLNISESFRNKMGTDLNKNLAYHFKQYDVKESIPQSNNDYYSYTIFTKATINETPMGSLSIFSINENIIMLNIVDFSIFFFIDDKSLPELKPVLNRSSSDVIKVFCINKNEDWEKIQYEYIKRALQSNS